MNGHPEDAVFQGVGVYFNTQTLLPVRSLLACKKSFQDAIATDERNAKGARSNFSRRYPYHEPSNPRLGGWSGTFGSLVLCIGIGIEKDANHDCLLRDTGVFLWTMPMLEKLGSDRGKRMKFLLQMFEFL